MCSEMICEAQSCRNPNCGQVRWKCASSEIGAGGHLLPSFLLLFKLGVLIFFKTNSEFHGTRLTSEETILYDLNILYSVNLQWLVIIYLLSLVQWAQNGALLWIASILWSRNSERKKRVTPGIWRPRDIREKGGGGRSGRGRTLSSASLHIRK